MSSAFVLVTTVLVVLATVLASSFRALSRERRPHALAVPDVVPAVVLHAVHEDVRVRLSHFVVVFNLTRFARDKYDHFALRFLLQSLGISLRPRRSRSTTPPPASSWHVI